MTHRLKIAAAMALVTVIAAAGGLAQESGPERGMMGQGPGPGALTGQGGMTSPAGMTGRGGMMGQMASAQMSRMMEGCHGMMLSMMQMMMGWSGTAQAPQPAPTPEKKG